MKKGVAPQSKLLTINPIGGSIRERDRQRAVHRITDHYLHLARSNRIYKRINAPIGLIVSNSGLNGESAKRIDQFYVNSRSIQVNRQYRLIRIDKVENHTDFSSSVWPTVNPIFSVSPKV
jgi:hypothetical protein